MTQAQERTPPLPVSIIVTPRERFSVSERCLESIIEHSDLPYELIIVDGGSPRKVRDYLARRGRERGFSVLRSERYLSPNTARNLGMARARGTYVVFIENDVIASPGWLSKLVECAEATGAAVVTPLICGGSPLHEQIHCAGGVCGIRAESADGGRPRYLFEKIARQGQRVSEVRGELERGPTQLAEFHCVLVRRDYLDRHGPFDAAVVSTREHVDFCLEVARDGERIYLEPQSVVTYLYDAPMRHSDLGYFMLRWSDRWERASLERMQRKYDLDVDQSLQERLARIGWRRREYLLKPLIRSLTRGVGGKRIENGLGNLLAPFERVVNHLVYARHAAGSTSGGA